jgi:UDP-N-acetylmuramate--alanine ligase
MGAVRTSHVFFLGLGGIGMSALARHLKLLGHEVGGYDLTPSPLLEMLANEGMDVTHSSEPMNLPRWAKDATPDTLTVVWTPAVPQDLPLLTHFKARGIVPIKRAALLGQITDGRPTLAVAGTHGKTTTSSWLAAMLDASMEGCHAFLGGISAASGSNHITRPSANWHVVEADEFDRSFHHLHPSIAAITNLEPDHLDIYGTEEAFRVAFEQFGSQVRDTLLLPAGLEWSKTDGPTTIERFTVIDATEEPDVDVNHVAQQEGDSVTFRLGVNGTSEQTPLTFSARPALLGKHNVANALVATAMAWHAGVSAEVIQRVVAQFGGVRRRMEVHLDHPSAVYVDDYAHHPTELHALLDAVRSRWPKREITLVFQPHLYSRTRDFGQAFAKVLGQADRLFLLPIYPAREAPIPGVDAQWLFDNISAPHKQLTTSDSIFGDLKARSVDVLVTAGAGDIDRLVPQALQHMRARLE